MTIRSGVVIGLLFFSISIYAQDIQKTVVPVLGEISFPTSANQAAQPYFKRGVLLLHSFEYERARTAFQQAEKVDPNFALAYWGEAMTYNQPIWNEQDIDAAKKVLNKLSPTDSQRIEKAKTAKEKGFIKAINLLYGKGTKSERDAAYAESMQSLYRQYPDDDEIGAFYALALLGKTEGVRDFQTYMEAAGIVEEITQHNPKHPGALHYAIHSYDEPIHAPLGLRAARSYAKIAPDASHALHMPSHIYLALGMWNDVVDSNKAAWAAGVKNNVTGNPKDYTIHDFHALEWLSYGYQQNQQYQEAYQLVKMMEKIAEESKTTMAKFHYAAMRAFYVIDSGNLNADLKSLDMHEMEPASHASDIYTNALIALKHKHNNAEIIEDMAELDKLGKTIPNSATTQGCHTDHFTSITPTGVLIAKITALELHAQIKLQQGKIKDAIKILKNATQLEDQMRVGYGPPFPIKPAHELLADVLLLDKQYELAYEAYVNELKRDQNRTLSVQGLKAAMEKIKELGLLVPKEPSNYFNKLMLKNN